MMKIMKQVSSINLHCYAVKNWIHQLTIYRIGTTLLSPCRIAIVERQQ